MRNIKNIKKISSKKGLPSNNQGADGDLSLNITSGGIGLFGKIGAKWYKFGSAQEISAQGKVNKKNKLLKQDLAVKSLDVDRTIDIGNTAITTNPNRIYSTTATDTDYLYISSKVFDVESNNTASKIYIGDISLQPTWGTTGSTIKLESEGNGADLKILGAGSTSGNNSGGDTVLSSGTKAPGGSGSHGSITLGAGDSGTSAATALNVNATSTVLSGTLTINTINTDTAGDNYLVEVSGVVKKRTPAEVLSDIGGSSTTGTVTSVGGTGTINGLTLTGTVTSSGNLTLGGTLAINNADWSGTDLAIANGGTGASNSDAWLNSRITTNANGSLNYDATGATAVNHDSLTGFVPEEHVDWAGASAGTIHASNYTDTNTNQLTTFNIGVDTNNNATTIAHGETLTFTGGTGINTTTTADGEVTISCGVVNTVLSTEQVQDIVGGMLVGTETRIGVTYDDTNGRIDFAVDDMTADTNTNQLTTFDVDADSGTAETIAHGNTLQLTGGTGISTTVSSTDTVTFALSSGAALSNLGGGSGTTFLKKDGTWATPTDTNTQNTTTLSFVDSSDDIILRNTTGGAGSGTDDIKFVAGSNITLTHTDADNITIASSGGGSNFVTDDADDTMAGTLTIDKNSTATTNGFTFGMNIDYDHTGITGGGQQISNIGLNVDMLNNSVTHVGTHRNYGIASAVRSNTTGTSTVYGIASYASIADTVYGIYNNTTGAGTTGYGIYQENDDGDIDYIQVSSANTADYFKMSTTTNGATTLQTVDADAQLAHLTIQPDGKLLMEMNPMDGEDDAWAITNNDVNMMTFKTEGGAENTLTIYEPNDASDKFYIEVGADGATSIHTVDIAGTDAHLTINADGQIRLDKPPRVKEQASADANLTAYGQIWVKNDTPNNLYFTNDAGNDVQITNGASLAGGGGSSGLNSIVAAMVFG